jgi:hypothetical protein
MTEQEELIQVGRPCLDPTLALSGASVATIARQMNRSEAAVRKRAVRLKLVFAKARLSSGLKAKPKS